MLVLGVGGLEMDQEAMEKVRCAAEVTCPHTHARTHSGRIIHHCVITQSALRRMTHNSVKMTVNEVESNPGVHSGSSGPSAAPTPQPAKPRAPATPVTTWMIAASQSNAVQAPT